MFKFKTNNYKINLALFEKKKTIKNQANLLKLVYALNFKLTFRFTHHFKHINAVVQLAVC